MSRFKSYLGELVGTFILVLIGCGSVAVAVVYYPLDLWQVAAIWGCGVTTAIYATKRYCPAHLNPAVSLAFAFEKKINFQTMLGFWLAQLLGAVLGGLVLYLLIHQDLLLFEKAQNIVRGNENSYKSAMMFGEYFPNPGFEDSVSISHLGACGMECLGTFILVLVILLLVAKPRVYNKYIPVFIGLTVSLIIIFVAPYTQAGLNPARDFGPRLVTFFTGWGNAALTSPLAGTVTVYILSPLLGGFLAHRVNKLVQQVLKY